MHFKWAESFELSQGSQWRLWWGLCGQWTGSRLAEVLPQHAACLLQTPVLGSPQGEAGPRLGGLSRQLVFSVDSLPETTSLGMCYTAKT